MGSEIIKVKEGLGQLVTKHNDALAATPQPAARQDASVDKIIRNTVEKVAGFNLSGSALVLMVAGAAVLGFDITGEPERAASFISTVGLPLCGWFIAAVFPVAAVDKTACIVKRLFPKWVKKKERLHAMREIERDLDYKKKMAEHTAVYAKAQKELAPVLHELNTSVLTEIGNVEYVLTAKGIEAIPRSK